MNQGAKGRDVIDRVVIGACLVMRLETNLMILICKYICIHAWIGAQLRIYNIFLKIIPYQASEIDGKFKELDLAFAA